MYLLFHDTNTAFNTDVKKIVWILTYMTEGTAGVWQENYWNDVTTAMAAGNSPTLAQFWTSFNTQFTDQNKEVTALLDLETFYQGDKTAEEFFAEQEQLKQRARVTDDRFMMRIVEKCVKPRIIDKIYETGNIPTTYGDWKTRIINMDNAYRRRKKNREAMQQQPRTTVVQTGSKNTGQD